METMLVSYRKVHARLLTALHQTAGSTYAGKVGFDQALHLQTQLFNQARHQARHQSARRGTDFCCCNLAHLASKYLFPDLTRQPPTA